MRLNEIAETYNQNAEQIENAFSVAAKGSLKAINELNTECKFILVRVKWKFDSCE